MYKALCVTVLLLPTFALTQARKPATPPFPSPLIVAKGKLPNQTAPIPTTTIFTPTQTGLYRLTVYATISKADPSSQSSWCYSLSWRDDAGPQFWEASQLLCQGGNSPYPFIYESQTSLGGTTLPFEAKAGTPITHNMTQLGSLDSSAYSLYYTLERME